MPPKGPGRGKLPVPLPKDMILKDTEGKTWRLGSQIGQGGFGLIYLASPQTQVPVEDDAVHVIKVEYLENGPLFSELKFYQRAAKQEHKGRTEASQPEQSHIYCVHTKEWTPETGQPQDTPQTWSSQLPLTQCYVLLIITVRKWMDLKKIRCLGIPVFWGSGLTEYKGKSYRFMVMERLGQDLQRILEDCGSKFKKEIVLKLGARMLDTLEYIHENEYVHGDIKAANLLLGYSNPHEVYLADYGLSYRYCPNGNHKQYQENPRKGHNGTIEFTSIDAHKGVAPSRRGDLEILGYCMLQWLCGKLPWEQNLKDPVAVQTAKTKLMDELPDSVLRWNSHGSSCSEIAKFLASVSGLAYAEKPKYQVLKKILLDGLESSGMRYDGPLEFSAAVCTQNHRAAKAPRVRLPKPPPKPAQQKGKKPGEEPACQNKACVGVTGTQLLGEGKPNTRSRKPPQGLLQQQAPLARSSPRAVQQKEDTEHRDRSSSLSRPHIHGTQQQLQLEEKPLRFYTTRQEPEHPIKEDTARELPPCDPYRILSESQKKHHHLVTPVPAAAFQAGAATIHPSLSTVFRLAFADETYPYTAAVLMLLLLIILSLYLL